MKLLNFCKKCEHCHVTSSTNESFLDEEYECRGTFRADSSVKFYLRGDINRRILDTNFRYKCHKQEEIKTIIDLVEL